MDLELRIKDLEERERIYLMGLRLARQQLQDIREELAHGSMLRCKLGFATADRLLSAALAGVDTTPRPCSVCRRDHGDEILHSSE